MKSPMLSQAAEAIGLSKSPLREADTLSGLGAASASVNGENKSAIGRLDDLIQDFSKPGADAGGEPTAQFDER